MRTRPPSPLVVPSTFTKLCPLVWRMPKPLSNGWLIKFSRNWSGRRVSIALTMWSTWGKHSLSSEIQCKSQPREVHLQDSFQKNSRISGHSAKDRSQPWLDIRHTGDEVLNHGQGRPYPQWSPALNRFLSRSADKYKPFFLAIKKNRVDFCWNNECEAAFQSLKAYLTSPLLLSKLLLDETLFLYLAVFDTAVSAALVQKNGASKNHSTMLTRFWSTLKRDILRLKASVCSLLTTRKLKQYFQSFAFVVLIEYPLRTIMENPEASRRIAKWVTKTRPLRITFEPRTIIKVQVLADFINEFAPGPPPLGVSIDCVRFLLIFVKSNKTD